MKSMSFLIAAVAFQAAGASAQSPNDWSVVVQQDGKQFSVQSPIKLKRAPFDLVFQGPKEMGYAVLASTQCKELVGLKSEAQIAEAIRPTNIAAETAARDNRSLVVNAPGAIDAGENTAHVWTEDKDTEQFSFQQYLLTPDGRATATREVRELVRYKDFKTKEKLTIPRYPDAQLCVLLTGLPPVGHMAHVNPKLLQLVFE